ncbi:MAG: 5'-3' exonuclease H3TH domain-containing protein [Myxococcota bacterium]
MSVDVHLVDGTYELFRSYYGPPGAKSPDGREVGAVRGLARSLLSLATNEGATHIAVAFDTVIESFRNQLFDGYKTGEGIDPDLWEQFPLAEKMTAALGFVVWPMVDFEADDALATGAHRFGRSKRVHRVLLCSPDKDLMQCVRGEEIVCVDRRRQKTFDEAAVIEKFGVSPSSIADYLALVGDTADGIPGIPRWGAKTTATVLAEYQKIEKIPDRAEDWKPKVRGASTLAANLSQNRQDALLYRTLATLRTDVPTEQSLDDLQWRGAHRDALNSLCQDIGDLKLLDRVPRWAGKAPVR